MDINKLLKSVVNLNSLDLHLKEGLEPIVRIDDELRRLKVNILTKESIEDLAFSLINDTQKHYLSEHGSLLFSFKLKDVGCFNATYIKANGCLSCNFKVIPENSISLEELNAPKICKDFLNYKSGILILSGPNGSGIQSTVTALLNEYNKQHLHIMTFENPIKFHIKQGNSLITQIDYTKDFKNFSTAFDNSVFFSDVDIIFIDRLDTFKKLQYALTASEYGYLVVTTMSLASAQDAIERLIYKAPEHEMMLMKSKLAISIKAIVTQILVPTKEKKDIAVFEVMINNHAISNVIKNQPLSKINSIIKSSDNSTEMRLQSSELIKYIKNKTITKENAIKYAYDPFDRELIEID